tara:strand:- start:123 stop:1058 length:936 start_codon:yes stop_codon:yes gene_type:complete
LNLVNHINTLLKSEISKEPNTVLFGQNIDAGSCLSGLTKGLSEINKGYTLNTPNIENALVGIGFGLMINGVNSIFFMKQLDFLLLGVDQLVNTYNIVRHNSPEASFTILPVTVDSGYEGPQASLNNIDDFCSIANVSGFSFTNKKDAENIIKKYLFEPGFKIISTGQRLLKKDLVDVELIYKEHNLRFFQYSKGKSVTIVCFNHALQYGMSLKSNIEKSGGSVSLFSINAHDYSRYEYILSDISESRKVVLIDDSKSKNRVLDKVLLDVLQSCTLKKKIVITPIQEDDFYFPREDNLKIDYDRVTSDLLGN